MPPTTPTLQDTFIAPGPVAPPPGCGRCARAAGEGRTLMNTSPACLAVIYSAGPGPVLGRIVAKRPQSALSLLTPGGPFLCNSAVSDQERRTRCCLAFPGVSLEKPPGLAMLALAEGLVRDERAACWDPGPRIGLHVSLLITVPLLS
ncbi:hypothetical protein SKAU_G00430250 [Synaphobranchus kaupii]|uniref:Uncharacterized protein n=1 Tax=Synaphobranchus kaupii TaxID=118154 RepID=A0A9Q1I973_SYNKA|nr:hypothetical protein SKAU_G00430250 [Synaphobranchus kaupii]